MEYYWYVLCYCRYSIAGMVDSFAIAIGEASEYYV